MASEDVHSHRLTVTQQEQQKVEYQVLQILSVLNDIRPGSRSLILELWRDKHIEFLMMGLIHLGPSFRSLDANRPWLCYWILHSAALIGEDFDTQLEEHIIDFLGRCQDIKGGYCGGPGQMPHLATTYAAVNSLLTLGGVKALSSIDRQKMSMFLRRMKDPYGGFRMHDGGEMDVRACYTAISVASILNILDYELVRNVGDYILSCQTYEGGIAGEPGSEAHGGYTFCGLATLVLIDRIDCLDLPRLIDWLVFRQGELEGGFQGRTNKLVDGCYSFWQGAVLDIIRRLLPADPEQLKLFFEEKMKSEDDTSHMRNFSEIGLSFLEKENEWDALFDSMALQQYILLCSQDLEGGFKDKPGKHRDYYHTCYCLSGLSVCQHSGLKNSKRPPTSSAILGPHSNRLQPVHPLYNIILDRYDEAHEYFSNA